MKNILVTCPPMLGIIDEFYDYADKLGLKIKAAKVSQSLTVEELVDIVPKYDGWIIGDDPACREVLEAGKRGKLAAAVKWGIGVDNVDFNAFNDLEIPVKNTPGMFGNEVADIALAYLIALSRHIVEIDQSVRKGKWIKPIGISLKDKVVGLVGFGDVGQSTAKRLIACEMKIIAYDPYYSGTVDYGDKLKFGIWPNFLEKCDFLILNCALTKSSYHLINSESIKLMKKGISIINVARGPIIEENSLIENLENGHIKSVALDVFEKEPLSLASPLIHNKNTILGSHNASNTFEAVTRTSQKALEIIYKLLNK